jgi:hypothetical protein
VSHTNETCCGVMGISDVPRTHRIRDVRCVPTGKGHRITGNGNELLKRTMSHGNYLWWDRHVLRMIIVVLDPISIVVNMYSYLFAINVIVIIDRSI